MIMNVYVLSGGKSSRMGEDKGLKLLNEKPVIKYLLETLENLHFNIKIVANDDRYRQFGFPVIHDIIKDKGPMGGIHTALSDAREDVLILSADTPLVPEKIIGKLTGQRKENHISIIRYNGVIQPLCGIFPVKFLTEIENNIKSSKLKMMDMLNELPVHYVDEKGEKEVFLNVNTPEDFTFVEQYFKNEDKDFW